MSQDRPPDEMTPDERTPEEMPPDNMHPDGRTPEEMHPDNMASDDKPPPTDLPPQYIPNDTPLKDYNFSADDGSGLTEMSQSDMPHLSDIPPPGSLPTDEVHEPEPDEEDWSPSKIVRRADWGAQKPKWIEALETPVNKIAVSYTESDPCYTEEECLLAVKELQKEHLKEDNVPDIKHNFLIGGDGVLYEGRGYTRVGPTYPPSEKNIQDLTATSLNVGLIERSPTQPTKTSIRVLSYCISNGINERYIEKDFTTYYIAKNEIVHIQPPDK